MPSKKIFMTLQSLYASYQNIIKQEIDLHKPGIKNDLSYEDQKKSTLVNSIPSKLTLLRNQFRELQQTAQEDLSDIRHILDRLEQKCKDPVLSLKHIDELVEELHDLKLPEQTTITAPLKSFPDDIRAELSTDIAELQKVFNAACYRSAVILCGRILEVALHRKYYEATEHDILEKSPGIGLGTLLAKLREKNIFFDPSLMNQIHLINMTRIFSVHKKQEPFNPTKEQAQATIIYTMDVLKRLFE